MQPIEKLKNAVHGWLTANEVDRDTWIYTQQEWRARDETCLLDSSLVLVFEGGMYSVVNSGHPESTALYRKFERLLQRFGYFIEFGHAWNTGFYPLPARCPNPAVQIEVKGAEHAAGERATSSPKGRRHRQTT
jgi:hypothetical protein